MLFTYTLPKSQETNIVPQSDEILRLTSAALTGSNPQRTNIYAIHGDSKFLITTLDPKDKPQSSFVLSFFSSQEIRLLSENADVNLFGIINQFDEFEEYEGEFEEGSEMATFENESESELDEEMTRPMPPKGYKPPTRDIQQKKHAKSKNGKLEAASNKAKMEPPREKKIKKNPQNQNVETSKKTANKHDNLAQISMHDSSVADGKTETQNQVNSPGEIQGQLVSISGISPVHSHTLNVAPKPIPNVSQQLGKMGNFSGKKRFEKIL